MINISLRKGLHGNLGAFHLDVQFKLEEGEIIALFGSSGVGKTTLLRCLAGLEQPDAGRVLVGRELWLDTEAGVNLPSQLRRAGYMFQDYALFPNMSVRGNLEFALPKGEGQKRIDELLDMMELGQLQARMPNTLSGGQKQRVALARTLASRPRLLLLDEPLSALDRSTRNRLQDELLRLQRQYGVTAIVVSHNVGEVYKLAQRVLILGSGKIVMQGTPDEVFASREISGKFRFNGEVLAIEPADVVFAVTVLVGNQIVRVIATESEAKELSVGCEVTLLSKAFNPMIQVMRE